VLNDKNKKVFPGSMASFGQRVKNVWKNIYPLQESEDEKKKKSK